MFARVIVKGFFLLLFFVITYNVAMAQTAEEYLKMADNAYNANEKDRAKELYIKAADMHNAAANFALAYKYVCTAAESRHFYSEAAKLGDTDAISYALETLFFRANSLTITNPELALDIYRQWKYHNPNKTFFDEESDTAILKMAIEADPFDAAVFIKKYHITEKDTNGDDYSIWELAEEASRSQRFGKPDPKLVFQLVCRGGSVPMELSEAIFDTYQAWKENKVAPFNICDYVTSGVGLAYCAEKESEENEKRNVARIKLLSPKLKNNGGVLLAHAYEAATAFIEQKTDNEEGWGGSGYIAWKLGSADSQKNCYLDLVEKVNNGFQPKLNSKIDYDKELNTVYKKIITELERDPIQGDKFYVDATTVRKNQWLWLKYRDATIQLFVKMVPVTTKHEWQMYLTKARINDLKAVEDLEHENE